MITVHTFSEVGGHRRNEDAYVVQPHPQEPATWLCFVADGQGGQAGGGTAARLACQAGLAAASRCSAAELGNPLRWSAILKAADLAVIDNAEAGLTTAVGLCVTPAGVVGASVGDSAALLCGEQAVELTAGQRKNPPVGSAAALPVPFAAVVTAPWQLLVLTDGVWKYVGMHRIFEAARQLRGAALVEKLQQAARLPGSGQFQDDFTVVLLENAS